MEHKPLPSIYDLHQMSAACDNLEDTTDNTMLKESSSNGSSNDSGLSDDDDEEDEVSDLETGEDSEEEEEDEEINDEPSSSPIFDPVLRGTTAKPLLPSPPKAIYNDRFWNNTYNQQQQQQQQHQQQQQQQPQQQNTFQFLDQTTQRIECENGKSYLQLGSMNAHPHPHHHHHLPVTPVIQPKPNMVYRRPIPPFRHMVSAASAASSVTITTPRPVCDHSNCLQKKNSYCYQSQRSRMLSLSLSKLHMARQSHDGSLRRSVLICNMLRYIEDETDKEAVAEANQFPNNSPMETQQETQQYWPPNSMNQAVSPPVSMASPSGGETSPIYPMASTPGSQQPPIFSAPNRELEPYENTLKDFNSAFRSTPYSSPAHPGSDMDSGIADEDRGINWSSVLSLSSQSELDPLNNNTFATEAWPNTANTPTTLSSMTDLSASASVSSRPATPMDTNCSSVAVSSATGSAVVNQGFDDIGWKLSADDVLKAFPNDENLFAVAGP